MIRKRFFHIVVTQALILLACIAFSCNQDAIFFGIENETSLKTPIISGGPSGIVMFNNALYVAGHSVFRYVEESETDQAGTVRKVARWRSIKVQPPGKVALLAATERYLYALSYTGADVRSMRLYRLAASGDAWDSVAQDPSYTRPNAIAGAGDTLFMGAYHSSESSAAVLYIRDDEEALTLGKGELDSKNGLLSGAAFSSGKYVVALTKQGLYQLSAPEELSSVSALGDSVGIHFSALMPLGGSILAVSDNGVIWHIPQAGSINTWNHGFDFTGAIALWEDPEPDPAKRKGSLLLLGRGHFGGDSDTYYDYGYFEIALSLDDEGTLLTINPNKINPGDIPPEGAGTTVSVNAKYEASIGIHSLSSLYQVPRELDGTMPIFASTHKDGLWSCRNKEWNVEG